MHTKTALRPSIAGSLEPWVRLRNLQARCRGFRYRSVAPITVRFRTRCEVVISRTRPAGFRTNLAMLATGRTAEVEVTFFYPDGTQAPKPWITTVWAGQLKQTNNVFKKFGLGGETVTGTLKIEILSGGDLIIYATEIDNRTGDSIFIPAQDKYINPAQ